MSRPRLFGCAVLAVLAVLLGGTTPAAAGPFLPDSAPAARAAAPARSGTPGALPTAAEPPATAVAAAPGAVAVVPAASAAAGAPGTAAPAPGPAPALSAEAGGAVGRAPLRAVPGPPEVSDARLVAAAVAGGRGPFCAPAAPDQGGTPAVPARAGGDHAQVLPGRPAPPVARPHTGLPVRVPVRGPDRPAPGPLELSVMRL
ncbi:hypothetical protein [Streptomyces erythrochromogenes]|uniref:hypothetical protein n=1 Tax=Streptomyces erythrochromogenes TaxID=285574 RepID=UPI00386DF1A1|nr:hypothetical protein OG489_19250 [Streptomyces erythrochromogenes]